MAHDTLKFLDSYRAAFERGDIDEIVDLYTFPCHVTGEPSPSNGLSGSPSALQVAESRDGWKPVIRHMLESYRRVGVKTMAIESVWTDEISPRLAVVRVGWHFKGGDGSTLYEFTSVYTLAEVDGRLRVTAVAHDEYPKLHACLERTEGVARSA